ncbi:MAG: fructosamine kinase [Bacteroidetes bacterium]|nr:MAG: fructosamine kinase [Bacteroidota bacterium]
MFEKEAAGLQKMAATQTIRIPEVIGHGATPTGAFLLLEFIASGARNPDSWALFGRKLAAFHQTSDPLFGWETDNYIGSLLQYNARHEDWPGFYIAERLQPQLEMARRAGHLHAADEKAFHRLYKTIGDQCPDEPPALIHGDLWSGNFLFDEAGQPVLFDPAPAFAHREMDLAMSRLFGGFDARFYRAYETEMPLAPGFGQRLEVYQLYYLMVHVNLFGGGYIQQVRNILKRFM